MKSLKTFFFRKSLVGTIVSVLLLPSAIPVLGQQLQVEAVPARIVLGEQFRLTIQISAPASAKDIHLPSVPDTINHLEVIERKKPDSIRQGDRIVYSQEIIMTGFDSGHWVLPQLTTTVNGKLVKSASVGIDVMNIKLTGKDYNDIKEIVEVEPPGIDWKKILLYGAALLIPAILVYYWWKNRKKKPAPLKPVSKASAYEEAMSALNELGKEMLMEKGEAKYYYSRLYDIYRTYMGAVTGKDLLQFTTDEILIEMKAHLNGSTFSSAAEALRISDAVKFAKYLPPIEEGRRSMEVIRQSIDELNRQKA
jgi:hypothetical protein